MDTKVHKKALEEHLRDNIITREYLHRRKKHLSSAYKKRVIWFIYPFTECR
jgi:hypothetical protein